MAVPNSVHGLQQRIDRVSEGEPGGTAKKGDQRRDYTGAKEREKRTGE